MSTKAQVGFSLLLFAALVAFAVKNPVHGHNAPPILEVRTFPVAVGIHAWQLAREGAQPKNKRRQLYHIPHSLDPRQFLVSMNSGKIEAEVGLFVDINAWETCRWWFTESELVYWSWSKAKLPIVPLDPDQIWENAPLTPRYYLDRHPDLPLEVAAVVNQVAAATAAKGSSSASAR